ncbi:hypothetical protein [Lentibacter sp. XHP0401]|uniref:hypothetical protein n=1 Tax=Lentibacter sp. XHP0401 TaxID=2984334 RepID=UPI0021E827D1|nr:hypothetical protein [Lentibacter sp. XHP0401]MCV2893727.1 hypothetical protein [Lentibacter sp. XHP0401]
MHKSLVAGLLGVTFLAGCAGELQEGKRVFIVPLDSTHLSQCKMLGRVEVNADISGKWDRKDQITEIKNRLRDSAAQKYPNADTVSHPEINYKFGGNPDPNIVGIVFNCFNNSV